MLLSLFLYFLGLHYRSHGGERYETLSFVNHPNFTYVDDFPTYDISVVTLDGELKHSYKVRSICLPTSKDEFYGKTVVVAGW